MNLTEDDIKKLIYCIDLIIQNFGENEDLKKLENKLLAIKTLK